MRFTWKTMGVVLVLGVALGVVTVRSLHTTAADGEPPKEESKAATIAELSPEAQQAIGYAKDLSRAFRETANRVLPSVVTIRGEFGGGPDANERDSFGRVTPPSLHQLPPEMENMLPPQFRPFFRGPGGGIVPRPQGLSVGSGVVVDESGVILTNNHVVSEADKIVVVFEDGEEYTATDVKCDPQTDLAIVRIEGAKDLVAAPLGDSDLVEVGDWVLALGNPFGRLSGSVTAGIVSAKDRNIGIADRESFIQTDAAINPGNSGGPLVNLAGEVIGINTAISSNTGTFAGVGLAIPSNNARWVVDQLKSTGEVKRAYLGVEMRKMAADVATEHGLKPNEGVIVERVREGTPASQAGLEPGDIVLKFGDATIDSPDTLQSVVERAELGKSYPMEVLRGEERLTLNVSVLERPKDFTRDATRGGRTQRDTTNLEELGLGVQTLTPELAKDLNADVEAGVVITEVQPGSPADMARLQPGTIILEANRTPVSTVEDFESVVNGNEKRRVLLKVRSDEGTWLQAIDWSGEPDVQN